MRFVKLLYRFCLKKYIKLPSGNLLQATIQEFETTFGFPQCAGAIDGTHIPIIAPHVNPKDYYNRKEFHSILMQAVVDSHYCFTDVLIGWPRSVHDARVFSNSKLYRQGQNGSLFPCQHMVISNVNVPILIVADPAYPLLPWVMKPFSDNGHLSPSQVTFNYRLSKARIVVENAFGRLKARWRCLLKRIDMDVNYIPDVVAACATLHNICEIHKDRFDNEWLNNIIDNQPTAHTT